MSTKSKSPPPTPSVSFADQNVHFRSIPPSDFGTSTVKPTFATSISQYDTAAALENDHFEDQVDGCLTPDPEDEHNRSKFRRGWAASSRGFQASTRSYESVIKKYRNQFESKKPVKVTEEYKKEHPNKPGDERWKQQKLPSWQPLYKPVNVIGTFLGTGVLLIGMGIFMFISNTNTTEIRQEYTYCNSTELPNRTCIDVLNGTLHAPANKSCQCTVSITIPEAISAPVFLYYSMDGFYQNHRRYINSVNAYQLRGDVLTKQEVEDYCAPKPVIPFPHKVMFAIDPKTDLPYAPCGAIANSFFTDEFSLQVNHSPNNFSDVTIKETDITWWTGRDKVFKNPPHWAGTVHPPAWTKNVEDLGDKNSTNYGYQNEHFIVWMETAAFSSFRKLWGRIEPDSVWKNSDVLPAGEYSVKIDYNYLTVFDKYKDHSFNKKYVIPKWLIISNTHWFGGPSLILPILYLVVGTLCIITGLFFIYLIWSIKKKNEAKTE